MNRTFDGKTPRVDASAFLHPTCEIIGSVSVGAEASVWPMAVLRADVGDVSIGPRTNIQDCAVVHCREKNPTVIGAGVTVGHGAIVHGARIGDRCLIGMGAIVMEAEVGDDCLIGAGAMVPAGAKVPAGSLVLGIPAKVVRPLNDQELQSLKDSEASYVALAKKHRETSKPL